MTPEDKERLFQNGRKTTPAEMMNITELMAYTKERMAERNEEDLLPMATASVIMEYGKACARAEFSTELVDEAGNKLVAIPIAELRDVFRMEQQNAEYILMATKPLEQKLGADETLDYVAEVAHIMAKELKDAADIFDPDTLDNTHIIHLLALDPDAVKQ